MREIEVKAKLKNKEDFLQAAAAAGITFGEVVTQEDTTYETSLPYADPNWNIFRLRKQSGKVILTMKYKASDRSRDNYEHETIVENEAEVIKMLERLGYVHGVIIQKQRRIATYQGLEFCMDEIKDLGSFVEVEKLVDGEVDIDAVQRELWTMLEKLGVNETDRTHKGYDTMMHELQAKT